jgi:hypothetical protein
MLHYIEEPTLKNRRMKNARVVGFDVGYEVATETQYTVAEKARDQIVTKTMLNKTTQISKLKQTTPMPFLG